MTKIIKRLHILLRAFLTWISYKNRKQGLKSGTPYIDIVLLFSGGKRGAAFSSIPMNRLNQTESAVSILVCLL